MRPSSPLPRARQAAAHRAEAIHRAEKLAEDSGNESDASRHEDYAELRTGHYPRPSPLSSESAGLYSYRGLLNLGMLIVFFANFHEIIYNFKKYGLIFSPVSTLETFYEDPYSWPSLALFFSSVMLLFVLVTFLLEKMVASLYLSDYADSVPPKPSAVAARLSQVQSPEEVDETPSRGRKVDPLSLVADTDTEMERPSGVIRHRLEGARKHVAELQKSLENTVELEEDESEAEHSRKKQQEKSSGKDKDKGRGGKGKGKGRGNNKMSTSTGHAASAEKHQMLEVLVLLAHVIVLAGLLIVPVAFIWHFEPHPMFAGWNLGLACIYFFKSLSYCWINREHRHAPPTSKNRLLARAGFQQYPNNVRVADFVYFLCAPTLVYDLNYPRSRSVRKMYILRRLIELFITVSIMVIIAEQYMSPLVRNALPSFETMDIVGIVERTLKLAVPNLYFWLCGFYAFFHLWLSVVAELLRFADREFYRDWWNATTIDYFWRNWNIPVHKWMLRHMYFPMRRMGFSRAFMGIAIFFVSGFFHEYMVSVPFQTLKLWAFLGMMAQVPLAIMTRLLTKGSSFGNVIFWLSIMLGQPLCILLYSVDYASRHQPLTSAQDTVG